MFLLNILYIPEFILTFGALTILLVSVFLKSKSFKFSLYASVFLLFFTFIIVLINHGNNFFNYQPLFISNSFISLFKLFIIAGSLFCLLILEKYFKDLDLEKFEIPILIIFSVLGMMIMISSNNLMTMYLGIELQSLTLYVVATTQKDSIKSSEAGLKYFVLGALSSGILLYGCSLIYGFTGSMNFIEIKNILESTLSLNIGLIFGLIFVMVALAFKVSAVPFHMWTPDVYEGAPTPITAYFAIVPKIAAICLFIRFLMEPFGNFWFQWNQIIIFLSIASMILGALAAIKQDNIKRLLAYSSIGHVGYILIGLASVSESGISGIIIYLLIYMVMNLSIFSILLSLKINNHYVESIKSLSGISKKNPIISIVLTIMMFSMAGLPPFAGFFAKFYIFIAAIESKLFLLAIIGVLSSVIAAYYYIRIVKIMYFDDSENNYTVILTFKSKIIIFFSTVFISLLILKPSLIINFSKIASYSLF